MAHDGDRERWQVRLLGFIGIGPIKLKAQVLERSPSPAKEPEKHISDLEDFDGARRLFLSSLAPAVCLASVTIALVSMLALGGYLSMAESTDFLEQVSSATSTPPLNAPARRAALAYSGITMAITLALSVTCGVWTRGAARGKDPAYRRWTTKWVVYSFLPLLALIALLVFTGQLSPFASEIGKRLLANEASRVSVGSAALGPHLMFFLACVVPPLLALGASLMLQPMKKPSSLENAKGQLAVLMRRLKDMDQLLYIGAMTLVFGTLQLSAAMSVPLASMPSVADIKSRAELCKILATVPTFLPTVPAGPAASVVPPSVASSAPNGAKAVPLPIVSCDGGLAELGVAGFADDLRKLVRGVTFSFGLAFSALLASIYVPAMIVLRGLMAEPAGWIEAASPQGGKSDSHVAAEVDPINRMVAIAATLSPLIAGVLANAVGK